jgi:hypothetical protein
MADFMVSVTVMIAVGGGVELLKASILEVA